MCDTCGCNITPGNEHLIASGGKLEKTESGREAVTVFRSTRSRGAWARTAGASLTPSRRLRANEAPGTGSPFC